MRIGKKVQADQTEYAAYVKAPRPPGGIIKQISVAGDYNSRRLYVLCEDNSVWTLRDEGWLNVVPSAADV